MAQVDGPRQLLAVATRMSASFAIGRKSPFKTDSAKSRLWGAKFVRMRSLDERCNDLLSPSPMTDGSRSVAGKKAMATDDGDPANENVPCENLLSGLSMVEAA
jgi:hypothetical protein